MSSAENVHRLLQYSANPRSREAIPSREGHAGRHRLRRRTALEVREAASPTDLLMSLNLSCNAVAMERVLGFLADAERALEDCSSCLARDVIVSEAQAAEHNRSIVNARNALHALRGQIRSEHGEVCRHLRDAQMAFLQSKPLISLATGYTGCDTNVERELLTSLLCLRTE